MTKKASQKARKPTSIGLVEPNYSRGWDEGYAEGLRRGKKAAYDYILARLGLSAWSVDEVKND
jgi:hypothetical protein